MPQSNSRQPFKRTAFPALAPVEIISQFIDAYLFAFSLLLAFGSLIGFGFFLRFFISRYLGKLEIIFTLCRSVLQRIVDTSQCDTILLSKDIQVVTEILLNRGQRNRIPGLKQADGKIP